MEHFYTSNRDLQLYAPKKRKSPKFLEPVVQKYPGMLWHTAETFEDGESWLVKLNGPGDFRSSIHVTLENVCLVLLCKKQLVVELEFWKTRMCFPGPQIRSPIALMCYNSV